MGCWNDVVNEISKKENDVETFVNIYYIAPALCRSRNLIAAFDPLSSSPASSPETRFICVMRRMKSL